MKFHELAIGSRFVFDGRPCIKTSSVMASEVETGKQVFMKRSSPVQPEDQAATSTQSLPNQVQQVLHDALADYRQSCLDILSQEFPGIEADRLSRINDKLQQSASQLFQQHTHDLN